MRAKMWAAAAFQGRHRGGLQDQPLFEPISVIPNSSQNFWRDLCKKAPPVPPSRGHVMLIQYLLFYQNFVTDEVYLYRRSRGQPCFLPASRCQE